MAALLKTSWLRMFEEQVKEAFKHEEKPTEAQATFEILSHLHLLRKTIESGRTIRIHQLPRSVGDIIPSALRNVTSATKQSEVDAAWNLDYAHTVMGTKEYHFAELVVDYLKQYFFLRSSFDIREHHITPHYFDDEHTDVAILQIMDKVMSHYNENCLREEVMALILSLAAKHEVDLETQIKWYLMHKIFSNDRKRRTKSGTGLLSSGV